MALSKMSETLSKMMPGGGGMGMPPQVPSEALQGVAADFSQYEPQIAALPHKTLVQLVLDVAGNYLTPKEFEDKLAELEPEEVPEGAEMGMPPNVEV